MTESENTTTPLTPSERALRSPAVTTRHSQEVIDRFRRELHKPLVTDRKSKRVEICIMKFNQPELEAKCVKSIIDNTEHPYKVNLYDNRVNSSNTSKVWNKFIKESRCPYVLIIDSDCVVTKGWLTEMMDVFKKKKDAGMVVPFMDGSSAPDNQRIKPRNILRPEDGILNADNFAVNGSCILFHRETILKKIGLFREDFCLYGQDSEMELRIRYRTPYKVYITYNAIVYHGVKEGNTWGSSMSALKAYNEGKLDFFMDAHYASELAVYYRNKYLNEGNVHRGVN